MSNFLTVTVQTFDIDRGFEGKEHKLAKSPGANLTYPLAINLDHVKTIEGYVDALAELGIDGADSRQWLLTRITFTDGQVVWSTDNLVPAKDENAAPQKGLVVSP